MLVAETPPTCPVHKHSQVIRVDPRGYGRAPWMCVVGGCELHSRVPMEIEKRLVLVEEKS